MAKSESKLTGAAVKAIPTEAAVTGVTDRLFSWADWLAFIITTGICQIFYVLTMAPSVTLEDSGELITAATHLGVPHPPGYPLWSVLTWLFTRIFAFQTYGGYPNPAWGANFASAFFGALCCGIVAMLISRSGLDLISAIKRRDGTDSGVTTFTDRLLSSVSGSAAGLLFAFCPFMWSQCIIAEVYALNAFCHMLIFLLAYAWMRRPQRSGLLYALALTFGLTFTNCQPVVLMVPAMMLVIFAMDRKLFRDCFAVGVVLMAMWIFFKNSFPDLAFGPLPNKEIWIVASIVMLLTPAVIWVFTRELFTEWRRVLLMLLFAGLGLSFFVYMPISSDFNPPMNWGYPRTWEGFKHAVTRGQYQALASAWPWQDPLQFLKQCGEFLSELEDQFPFPLPMVVLIPVFYVRRFWRSNWAWLVGTVIAFLTMGPGMMVILNPPHDVQSLFIAQVQFVQSTAVYTIWVGYGLLFALVFVDRVLKSRLLLGLILIIVALTPLSLLWQNYGHEGSGTELNGHDYGWQFGYFQLRGINGIKESLKPGELPPPNPAYPPEMTPHAIFFGGTDPGRFVPTYMIYCPQVRSDVFLITQNALADNTYMNVMRDLMGDDIWMPTPQDTNVAFQKYVEDVRAGRIPQSAAINIDKNGKVSVQGVQGVMEINGIICKMIFDWNKHTHDFYVEESYVIPWMYPYMEPHGLILKVNKEPLSALTPAMVKNDTEFWNWYANRLLNDRKFLRDDVARKTFSKLRCAIAGLYSYRRMFNEAEAAFRQAVLLYPCSPEANFRLADLYLQQGRFSDAVAVMETNFKLDPNNDKIDGFIKQIKDMAQTNTRIGELQKQLSAGGGSLDQVFELATLYQRTGKEQLFSDLSMQILNNSNLPPQAYLKVAELAGAGTPRVPIIAEAFQRYIQREPGDPRIWFELACAQAVMGQKEPSFASLRQAIGLGGEPIKDSARKDQRLEPLKRLELFQKMTAPAQQNFGTMPGFVLP